MAASAEEVVVTRGLLIPHSPVEQRSAGFAEKLTNPRGKREKGEGGSGVRTLLLR